MDYQKKYLKYKSKYISLTKSMQKGGSIEPRKISESVYLLAKEKEHIDEHCHLYLTAKRLKELADIQIKANVDLVSTVEAAAIDNAATINKIKMFLHFASRIEGHIRMKLIVAKGFHKIKPDNPAIIILKNAVDKQFLAAINDENITEKGVKELFVTMDHFISEIIEKL